MTEIRTVAVLVGSLRKASLSRKVAMALAAMAPASLRLEIVEIGDLPHYNQDLESAMPAAWTTFRDRIRPVDAVLFVTPEYNRSVPGALKNAIEVGSRPMATSVWRGKPCGVVSVSPGPLGGFSANHHLRASCVALDMPTMAQPEAYIHGIGSTFDASGAIVDEAKRTVFAHFITAFAVWVEQLKK
jgi:chromate reductase, NAD(P)H dehydrogenase (quinone)